MRQGPLLVAIVVALLGLTSVAAGSPETTESTTSSNPFAWLQWVSLVLTPIILILIAVLGVWRLPPSPRISAWRIPVEIGALAFASSILLQGLGIWTAMSVFGQASESATLRPSGLSVLGGYLGNSFGAAGTAFFARYKPGKQFGMKPAQEWSPKSFHYLQERTDYDYFIISSGKAVAPRLFRGAAPGEVVRVAEKGTWQLYRRRQ